MFCQTQTDLCICIACLEVTYHPGVAYVVHELREAGQIMRG